MNVDLTRFQFQFDRVHEPGSLNAENAPIEFMILHPRHCRMPPTGDAYPLQTLNSQILYPFNVEAEAATVKPVIAEAFGQAHEKLPDHRRRLLHRAFVRRQHMLVSHAPGRMNRARQIDTVQQAAARSGSGLPLWAICGCGARANNIEYCAAMQPMAEAPVTGVSAAAASADAAQALGRLIEENRIVGQRLFSNDLHPVTPGHMQVNPAAGA